MEQSAKEIAYTPADSGDRKDLIDILTKHLTEHGVQVKLAKLAAAIDAILKDPSLGFLQVARMKRGVVGVAYVAYMWSLEYMGKTAWLDELHVERDERGQGIGTELLRSAIDRARREGCVAMDLEVDQAHQRAELLYDREGFSRHARNRFYKLLSDA